MDSRKVAVLLGFSVIAAVFSATFVSAYDGEGSLPGSGGGSSTSTAGYSENTIYDMQASWIFEDQSSPDSTGPSVFFGSQVVKEYEDSSTETYSDDGTDGLGNEITLQYVQNSQDGWGNGTRETVTIQKDDWYLNGSGRDGFAALIRPPHPDANTASNRCGDTAHDDGNNESSCPEDYGLPSDSPDSGSEDSSYDSQDTITRTFNDRVGDWDANNANGVSIGDSNNNANNGEYLNSKNNNDDTDDNIEYRFSNSGLGFVAPEAEGQKNHDISGSDPYTSDLRSGTQSDAGETDDQVVQDQQWSDVPDYYLEDGDGDGIPEELWMVYPEKVGETTMGSVTDYDLTGDKNVETWDITGSAGTCSGVNCSTSGSVCSSVDQGSDTKYTLEGETTTTVSDNGNEQYYADSSGSYQHSKQSSNLDQVSVEVTHHPDYNTETVDDDSCGGYTTTGSCTGSGGCSSGSTNVASEVSDQDIATGQTSNTVTYRYEDIELKSKKIFDLNPAENPSNAPMHPADALFWDDSYKGETYGSGNVDKSDLSILSNSGTGYYSWDVSENSEDLANDPSTSISSFSIDVDGTDFYSKRDSFETYDVDGPRGIGNGYVAMRHDILYEGTDSEQKSSNWQIVGTTPNFATEETSTDGSSASFVDESQIETMMKNDGIACPGDSLYCVAAVDLHMNDINEWGSTDPSNGVDLDITSNGPFKTSDSMGVCEMYNKVSDENAELDDSENVQCQYDNKTKECDIAGNRWHKMEGPEVDKEAMDNSDTDLVQDHSAHCVQYSECVLHDDNVSEGTVTNVAHQPFKGYPGYEQGSDSPDWEVCLNINDDSGYHEFGGQWYDLDNSVVGEYLRGEITGGGEGTSLVSGADTTSFNPEPSGGQDHIENYWMENPNPQHSTYNPKGGMEGTALVAHCGPDVNCGEDDENIRGDVSSYEGNYFSFFQEYSRDEDYHPQGRNEEANFSHRFEGVLTKIRKHPDNNQLSPSHYDHSIYTPEWYRDTETGEDQAVQYGYAVNRSWTLDSTGVPYPPWGESGSGYADSSTGIHYREGYSGSTRQDPADSTVQKTSRAFGNSLAVVAQQDIGAEINEGDGFWIDPDNIRQRFDEGNIDDGSGSSDGWKNFVSFKIDLTGPDSGLGWDYSGSKETRQGGSVVFTDIAWERGDNGNIREELQTPMCGDDRYEFLIEEMGESPNSEQFTGPYGCSPRQDICYSSDVGEFVEVGSYQETNEPTEDVGRYKQDEEYCGTNEEDLGVWLDQDINSNTCRENSLYGSSGVRWFDSEYVENYPYAVTGGIDDSWNEYAEQHSYESRESRPNRSSWNFDEQTPVPTGTNRSQTASLGFCGGDDGGEYLVTQECETSLCETKRKVQGVAKVPGSCVFDGDQSRYSSSVNDRRLYQPGEEITINLNSQRSIVCFNGAWHEKTPISFSQENIDIPLDEEVDASFQLVNVRDQEVTYEVSMIDPLVDDLSVYQLSNFREENGDSFRVTLGPRSSENYQIGIRGGTLEIDGDESNSADRDNLELRAEGVNSDISGYDTLTVDVVDNNRTETGSRAEPDSVPGIGTIQLMVLTVMASALFFLQS